MSNGVYPELLTLTRIASDTRFKTYKDNFRGKYETVYVREDKYLALQEEREITAEVLREAIEILKAFIRTTTSEEFKEVLSKAHQMDMRQYGINVPDYPGEILPIEKAKAFIEKVEGSDGTK